MKNKNIWAGVSILNLSIVAILGFTLRSKILFDLPWINYLNLLDAHLHFAFGAWITLALLLLLVQELLTGPTNNKYIYQYLFGAILLSSFGTLLNIAFNFSYFYATFFSAFFIAVTYFFSWVFLKDIAKAQVNKTVRLLSVCAIISLLLSSAGPIALTYLHSVGSVQPLYYQDALYIYLHLQYNGFFPLAVFALGFYKLYPRISKKGQQRFYWFSILLCLSVLPSLFLSFLWQGTSDLFRIIAMIGSGLIFLSVSWFIACALPFLQVYRNVRTSVRYIIFFSFASFVVKMFLQGMTIITPVGKAVFGDRPVIIGFLHLVFLGFISPFILAWYVHARTLDDKTKLTSYALLIFLFGALFNEITLMIQGLGAMFLKGSSLFSWVLWVISLTLMIGAILILVAAIKSKAFIRNR